MGEQRPDGEQEPTVVDPFAAPGPGPAHPWGQPDRWAPPVAPEPGTPAYGPRPHAQPGAPAWGPPTQQQPNVARWGTPGQPPPNVPAWGPPPAGPRDPWAGYPLVGEERAWVPAVHWLPLLTTWLGPMVVLLTVGERNARVREHALDSLNFEITFWLGMLVSALLTWVLVGFLFLALLPIVALVQRIIAAVEAARGHRHRYVLSLRFVR